MKRILLFVILSAGTFRLTAQGLVGIDNTAATLMRTNAVGFGGTVGNTAPTPLGFYYGLFIAPTNVTTLSPSLQELLTPTWTFTGVYATNSTLATGGRMIGGGVVIGGNIVSVPGWAPGTFESFAIVGWSANLGHDWSTIASQLSGETFYGSFWSGDMMGGFLGASQVGLREAGGPLGNPGFATPDLFGTGPDVEGQPITIPTTLWGVTLGPEPSSFSFAAAFGLAALCLRKKKSR